MATISIWIFDSEESSSCDPLLSYARAGVCLQARESNLQSLLLILMVFSIILMLLEILSVLIDHNFCPPSLAS